MTPAEFAARLDAEAAYLDQAARVAAEGFEAGLADALAARCRDLASEARLTDAASFEALDDRRAALSRSALAPPNRGFRFVPRRRPTPTALPPGSDVFDPDTGAGWGEHAALRPAAR